MKVSDFLRYLFNESDTLEIRYLPEKGAENPGKALTWLATGPEGALQYLKKSWPAQAPKSLFPCIGVNPRDARGKVKTQRTLFVDIDNAPLPEWAETYADAICSRDEKHHHLFFMFRDRPENEKNRESFSAVGKRFLKLTGSKEKAAHDSARVVRLPDVPHRKNGVESGGYKVKFLRPGLSYFSFDERFAFLSELEKEGGEHEKVLKTEPAAPAAKTSENVTSYLYALYKKKPALAAGDGRSRELFFIGLDCHAWGVERTDAVKLAQRITNEKHEPPESPKVVAHQIASAYKYRRGEFGDIASKSATLTDRQKLRELRKFELINRARDEFATWVYCHGAVRFIDKESTRVLTASEQIASYIATRLGERIPFDDLLAAGAIETVDAIDYAPDIPEKTFTRRGITYVNSYRPPEKGEINRKRTKNAVAVFLEHIGFITTSEQEERTLLSYLAYAIQNPGKKIAFTPLIITPKEGVGKSFFAELLEKLCGENNVSPVSSHDLLSKYNDFIAEKLWVIAHEVETGDKNALAQLKSVITEKRVRVDGKYARTYMARNLANFLLLSNKLDALKSDRETRRLFVIYNNAEPKEQAYYDRLFGILQTDAEAIREFLENFDVSGFNPHARPPKTAGWEMLARASESDLASFLNECEREKSGPFANEFFLLRDLTAHIENNAQASARYATNRALAVWLYGRGYQNREAWPGGKHVRAWTKLDQDAFSEAVKKQPTQKQSFL